MFRCVQYCIVWFCYSIAIGAYCVQAKEKKKPYAGIQVCCCRCLSLFCCFRLYLFFPLILFKKYYVWGFFHEGEDYYHYCFNMIFERLGSFCQYQCSDVLITLRLNPLCYYYDSVKGNMATHSRLEILRFVKISV